MTASRTAAFDRKRPEISNEGQHQGNDNGDEVPLSSIQPEELVQSASPNAEAERLMDRESDDEPRILLHNLRAAASSGLTPLMNWNAGSKAKIRTTLGGNRPPLSLGAAKLAPVTPEPTSPLVSPGTSDSQKPKDVLIDSSTLPPANRSPVQSDRKSGAEYQQPDDADSEHFYSDPEPGDAYQQMGSLEEDAADSTSDGGVMINIEGQENGSGQESGEISDDPKHNMNEAVVAQDIVADDEKVASEPEVFEGGEYNTESEKEAHEDDQRDAMMDYSASDQVPKATMNMENTHKAPQKLQPRFLADLSPEDLKLQLRYFYIVQASRDRKLVDMSLPVHCLVCGKIGHMSDYCDALTCATCGNHKDHFTRNCPSTRKCEKCCERGHSKHDCPYKLPRLTTSKLECDLCQRIGHTEDECELLWRTSGRTWESDLPSYSLRLYCYECGNAGHLGNECPSRNPRKPMGSSTWSARAAETNSGSVSVGISVRARAQQNQPIEIIDDSDDDRANFHRPRIPPPVRSGQIRVANTTFSRPNDTHRSNERPPSMKQSYDSFRPQAYPSVDRNQGRPLGDHYQYQQRRRSRSPGRDRYDRRDAQRRSVVEMDRDRYYGYRMTDGTGDSPPPTPSSQPPLPKGKPPNKKVKKNKKLADKANVYRPLPSAAQQAWKKGRT